MFEALSTSSLDSSLSTSINYGRKKKPEKPLNAQMKNCKIERKKKQKIRLNMKPTPYLTQERKRKRGHEKETQERQSQESQENPMKESTFFFQTIT